MSAQFPPCPASLKSIQHYLKTAAEHDQRDPVVSYWCRLYALQCALKIDKKSEDAIKLLTSLMDWLETQKKALSDNEAITNEVAAQAHLENYALKLFQYADGRDRASDFGKNVVKAFYTAGMLFDVLQIFGELTDEIVQNRKYSKWKAAYIHNCLKNGETPIPGPVEDDTENENEENAAGFIPAGGSSSAPFNFGFVQPQAPSGMDQPPPSAYVPPNPAHTPVAPFASQPIIPTTPNYESPAAFVPAVPSAGSNMGSIEGSGVVLKPAQLTKAQKYCKWASSALNYEDVPTAIMNLEKALKLLQTGIDSNDTS
ncbi:vacuolar protein sorting-associated protein VTA1 homolog [Anabrus simplex]|uniref:vacuolar protein sorting-associated protein VTA1 homolog n=1 Tax=Anabrus simplex TaxID=316456 RepID=UPI0035A31B7B